MKNKIKISSFIISSVITPMSLGVMGTLAVVTKHPGYIAATIITLLNMAAVYWVQKRINDFEGR